MYTDCVPPRIIFHISTCVSIISPIWLNICNFLNICNGVYGLFMYIIVLLQAGVLVGLYSQEAEHTLTAAAAQVNTQSSGNLLRLMQ